MTRDYSCPSCAGNLSLVEGKKIYKCNYCGKLYTADMEIIDIKLIDKLRTAQKNGLATLYLDEMLADEPDNYLYLWERLNCSLTPNLVSDYMIKAHGDTDKLMNLQKSEQYIRFRDALSEEQKKYTDEISKYTSLARAFAGKSKVEKTQPENWNVKRTYDAVERYRESRAMIGVAVKSLAVIAALLIGWVSRSGLVLLICLAAAMAVIIFYDRYDEKKCNKVYEETKNVELERSEERQLKHDEKVKELADLRSEMNTYLDNIRKHEELFFDLISQ